MADFDEASETRKRPAPSPTSSTKSVGSSSKRSKSTKSPNSTEKSSRGLRHFSMMVCQKVEEKGTTTYNEVADELVKKVKAERERESEGKFDEKNIRRRVYDALNVLMAMDIISKEKKEITWRGLPSIGKQDLESLRDEAEYRKAQLQQKKDALQELLVQQVCFRNLVWRNQGRHVEEKIPLPFIVVNTHASAIIQCDMNKDKTDVRFDFSMPIEINDDNTILKKMGLDKTNMSILRSMLPGDLLDYCQDHRLVDAVLSHERQHMPMHTHSHNIGSPDMHPSMMPPHHHHHQPPPHHSSHHQYHHQQSLTPPQQHHHSRGGYPPQPPQQHYSGFDPLGV